MYNNNLFNQFLATSKAVSKTANTTPEIRIKRSGGVDITNTKGVYAMWYYMETQTPDMDKLQYKATAALHFITTDTEQDAKALAVAVAKADKVATHTALLDCKSGTQIKMSQSTKYITDLFYNYIEQADKSKITTAGKGTTAVDTLAQTKAPYKHAGKEYNHYYYAITIMADMADADATELAKQTLSLAEQAVEDAKADGTTDADKKAAADALADAKALAQSVADKITARTNKAKADADAKADKAE